MIFTDQLHRKIELNRYPARIVSIVPSQTEFLFDLGLGEQLVGITKFCIHPPILLQSKQHIGGTKNINLNKIRSLAPDLIIGNKEENDQKQVELMMQEFPVWMSDIKNLSNALDMMSTLGAITDKTSESTAIVRRIREAFEEMKASVGLLKNPTRSAAYIIWKDPWMSINKDTFIHDLMERIGLVNVFANHPVRYPEFNMDALKQLNPSLLLLSSEPYPFKLKHLKELEGQFPESEIQLVDGEIFSWYGSRLLQAVPYLQSLITSNNH